LFHDPGTDVHATRLKLRRNLGVRQIRPQDIFTHGIACGILIDNLQESGIDPRNGFNLRFRPPPPLWRIRSGGKVRGSLSSLMPRRIVLRAHPNTSAI
jgi:hypothetical protein